MTGKCSSCSGTGKIRAFSHIDGGKCYTCKGSGKVNAADVQASEFVCAHTSAWGALVSVRMGWTDCSEAAHTLKNLRNTKAVGAALREFAAAGNAEICRKVVASSKQTAA